MGGAKVWAPGKSRTADGLTRRIFFVVEKFYSEGINVERNMARPALTFDERDRQLVRVMARLQARQSEIAAELGICEKTLRARFGNDLHSGRAAGEGDLVVALYQRGIRGNVAALKLWWQRSDDTRAGKGGSVRD